MCSNWCLTCGLQPGSLWIITFHWKRFVFLFFILNKRREKLFFPLALGIHGSEMFAEMDLRAIKPYQNLIKEVGLRHCVDPALVAAIISRESHGGTILHDGWDHTGAKFGLMQVRAHCLPSTAPLCSSGAHTRDALQYSGCQAPWPFILSLSSALDHTWQGMG